MIEYNNKLLQRHIFGGALTPVIIANQQDFQVDEITGAIMTIGTFHHEIHEGETYIASNANASIANNASISIHLTPGTHFDHLTIAAAAGGDALIELCENPTIAGGVALTPRNMKRTAPDASDTVVLEDVTVNACGTLIVELLLPGGTGGNAGGGNLGMRQNSEFILDPTKTYSIELTNIAGSAKPVSLIAQWYEESDD